MKHTKEELYNLLNKEDTVNNILNIIKNRLSTELPMAGNLCGQSVASAFFELAELNINPVYNDVDIFYVITHGLYLDSENMSLARKIQSNRKNSLSDFYDFGVEVSGYEHISTLSMISQYTVRHSFSAGPLNKTYISSGIRQNLWKSSDHVPGIISNFDINSTQIGISLESKTIHFTKDFIEFCLTKQLKISHWNTPNHSLIRLQKKSIELGGTYVDIEEAKMIAMTYTGSMINMYETNKDIILSKAQLSSNDKEFDLIRYLETNSNLDSMPLFFGKKHKSDFEKYFSDHSDLHLRYRGNVLSASDYIPTSRQEVHDLTLIDSHKKNDYFRSFLDNLKSSNVSKFNIKSFNDYIKKLEFLFYEVGAGALKSNLENIDNLESFTSKYADNSNTYMLNLLLPYSYNSIMNTRVKSIKHFVSMKNDLSNFNKQSRHVLSKDKLKKETLLNTVIQEIELVGFKDISLISSNLTDNYKLLTNVYAKHDLGSVLTILNISEWLVFAKNLKYIEKNMEFGHLIYGLFESDRSEYNPKNFLDLENMQRLYRRYISDLDRDIVDIDFSVKISGLEVSLLKSKRDLLNEGDRLSHCVGGYGEQIKNENSLIFSVKGVENYTIELSKVNDKYELLQARGFNNKKIEWKYIEPVYNALVSEFHVEPIQRSIIYSNISGLNSFDIDTLISNNVAKENIVYSQYRQPQQVHEDMPVPTIDIYAEDIPF